MSQRPYPRPVWARCLERLHGNYPAPPDDAAKHDAILVLSQPPEMPPDAMDIEALRILDGVYERGPAPWDS